MVVLAGNTQQEICEVGAGLGPEKQEAAVELSDRIDVDLIVVELAAGFDGVSSEDF